MTSLAFVQQTKRTSWHKIKQGERKTRQAVTKEEKTFMIYYLSIQCFVAEAEKTLSFFDIIFYLFFPSFYYFLRQFIFSQNWHYFLPPRTVFWCSSYLSWVRIDRTWDQSEFYISFVFTRSLWYKSKIVWIKRLQPLQTERRKIKILQKLIVGPELHFLHNP